MSEPNKPSRSTGAAAEELAARASGRSSMVAPRTSPEDLALIKRLRQGEEAAFAGLVEQYHGRLLRLARAFVSSEASAEEVVQDTWVGVLNGLGTFEARSSLKSWIFRILTNRAKTRGVREARSVPMSALGDAEREGDPAVDPERFTSGEMWARPPRPWEDDTPERLVADSESMAYLEGAIAELPANQRAVFTLRDIEGLDSEEACNVLEISETNQRVLLHRARSKLRGALEQYLDKGS